MNRIRRFFRRTLLLAVGLAAWSSMVEAQTNIANYTFSSGTSTYTDLGASGTVFTSGAYDNSVSAAITMGGTFPFGGVNQTTCYISTNGFIYFGAAPGTAVYTPLSTAAGTGAISPYGQDAGGTVALGSEIRYFNTGTEFVVQYKNHSNYYNRANGESLNFQIRLTYATGVVKFVYGTCACVGTSTSGTPCQVGIRGSTTTWADNVNILRTLNVPAGTTCNWATAVSGNANSSTMWNAWFTNSSISIPSGLTYTWAPPSTAVAPVRTFAAVTGITPTGATLSWTAPTGATVYNVRYRIPGTCAWTNWTGNPVATNSVTLTGLTQSTSYQVQVQASNGVNTSIWSHIPNNTAGAGTDGYTTTGTFTTTAACSAPTITAPTSVTTNSATLNWTAPGAPPSNGYEYEVRSSGAAGSGVTGLAASGSTAAGVTTANVTGLTANTTYSIYLRSNCGGAGYSVWTSAYTFTTACAAITSFPWTEGFEGVSPVGAGLLPNCWGFTNITGTNSPGTYGTNDTYREPHAGTNLLYTQYNTTAWVYTPGFQLTTGTTYQFSFWMKNKLVTSPVDFTMDVAYGSSASAASMTNSLASGVVANNSAWTQFTYTVTPATSGTYYFGIKSTSATTTPWYLSFDDFSMNTLTACSGTPVTGIATGFMPLSVTGYNADIVANGTGLPSSVTTADADGVSYYLVDKTYRLNGSSTEPTQALPANGRFNSAATTGLPFQLASAYASNSLRLTAANPNGTLNISGAPSASTLYILATAGSGGTTTTFTGTITFTDATTQAIASTTVPDWGTTGGTVALANIGRVTSAGATATGFYLFQLPVTIANANLGKTIASISFARAATSPAAAVINVMGVSAATTNTSAFTNCGTYPGTTLALQNIAGISGLTYQWASSTTPGGPYTDITGATGASYTTSTLTSSMYYVAKITCTNGGGMSTSNEVAIKVAANPTVTVSPNPANYYVSGTPVTVTASGASTYTWASSVGLSAGTGTSVDASPTPSGTYTYNVYGIDANGCLGTATLTVNSLDPACSGTPAAGLATGYTPVTVTGFNKDIIANGEGLASASTSGAIDGSDNRFVDQTFRQTATSAAPTYALPASGMLNATGLAGLNFKMANATGNNALELLTASPSGSLTLSSPQPATTVYLLAVSTELASTVDVTVTFADATTQVFTAQSIPDWYTAAAASQVTTGIGRVNSAGTFSGDASNPHLFFLPLALNAANYAKNIASIAVTKTSTGTNRTYVMGVSLAAPTTNAYTNCGSYSTTLKVVNTPTGVSGITYQWASSTTPGGPYTDITGATATTYSTGAQTSSKYYVVKIACSFGGTSTSNEVAVLVAPNPTVAVTPATSTYCSGGTPVSLTASGASTYLWIANSSLSSATGTTVTATPAAATTYTVFGTATTGCLNTATATVNAASAYTATATASPTAICTGGSAALNVTTSGGVLPVSGYCTPTSTGLNNATYFLSNFTTTGAVTNINYSSGAPSTTGAYSNFTSVTGAIAAGTTVNYTITVAGGSTYCKGMWVDMNQDGDFADAGEQVVTSTGFVSSPLTGTFTIPTSAYNGTTRLRVVQTFTANTPTDPCTIGASSGEFEDYSITISGATSPPAPPAPTYAWTPAATLSSGTVQNPTATPTTTTTYNVTATNAAGCTATSSATVNVNPLPTATISGTAAVCQNSTAPSVTFTGAGGTTPYIFTYNVNGGINQTVTTSGASSSVTVSQPTGTAGSFVYTLVNVVDANCAQAQSGTATITVNPQPTVSISGTTTVCQNATAPSITFNASGSTAPYTITYNVSGGGNQTVTTDNAGVATVSQATATAGAYTYNLVSVQDASATTCSASASGSATVTVTAQPSATIAYGGSPYCANGGTATVTMTGTTGGTYSSTTGLTINSTSGDINLAASTAGTYTVTYSVAASGGCAAYSTMTSVTITPTPFATISYAGTPYCSSVTSAPVTHTGTNGGTYSSATGLSINASTGEVDPNTSTAGTYTVTYSVTASGGCAAYSTTTSITITTQPAATISYTGTPYCTSDGTANVTMTGTTGGTYSSTAGLSINASTGAVNLAASTPGTYTVHYDIAASGGCAAVNATASITVTPAPAATIAYAASPYCANSGTATVTHTGTNGGTYSSTTGLSINGTSGDIDLAASTVGTYTVTYSVAASGGCAAYSTTTSVTITPVPSAAISYAGTPYCNSVTSAPVTHTGTNGGTYASTTGLSINASTGEVDPSTSTAGTYTVTYSVAASGGCAAYSTTTSITITTQPAATIAYGGTPYCANGGTASVTMTGTTGGTYSSTTGLSINAMTGAVDLAASTPGTYTVHYDIAASGGCAAVNATASITITPTPSATISYAGTPYCNSVTSAMVTHTGTNGGTYSSTSGLSINATTGEVDPSASTAGTYTVTYSVAASGGCAAYSTTTSITINTQPAATIAYAGTPYCANGGTANVTMTGTSGGTYSSTTGLSINASTGAVDLAASTPGTYTVHYDIAASGGCAAVNATASITITPTPSATIAYSGSPYCANGGTATATHTGTNGGTYSSTTGLSINGTSGDIDLAASTAGTYTVTYSVAASGGCAAYSTTTSVTITPVPGATISYASSPYCNSLTAAPVTMTGTSGGTYSSTGGLTINASTGTVNPSTSTAGTYTVTYSVAASGGCAAYSTTTSITITTQPAATISYAGTPYCSNSGTANVTMSGTTGGTYSSTTGLSINASTGAVTLASSTPGTYTVTYAIPASGGCAAVNAMASITINAAPGGTFAYAGAPYCSTGGTATVTGSSLSTGGTYTSTAGLSINASTGAVNLSASTAGTYTVTYSVAASGGCAAYSTTASITINPATVITTQPAATTTKCVGQSFTLTVVATNATGYQWNLGGTPISGATSASYTVASATTANAGTYAVTVSGTGACPAVTSNNAVVNINALPSVTVSSNSPNGVCVGSSAILTASGANTYSWAPGGSTTNPLTVTPTVATTYTVTGTTTATGCTNTATITVNVGSAFAISTTATPASICSGNSSSLAASSSAIVGAAPVYCTPTVAQAGATSDYIANFTLGTINNTTGDGPGDYNYYPTPVPNITAGIATTFSVTAGTTGSQYFRIWVDLNQDGTFQNTESQYVSTAGTAAGVTVTNTITIPTTALNGPTRLRVNTKWNSAVAAGSACSMAGYGEYEDYKINVTGATNVANPNPLGTVTYAWNNGGGTGTPVTVSPTATTTYTVTGTSQYGCTATATQQVTVTPGAAVTTQPVAQTKCVGQSFTLSVVATNAGSYQWFKNSTAITGATAATYTVASAALSDAGNYYVQINNASPCTGSINSSTVAVTINPLPVIAVTPSAPSICSAGSNTSVSLTASGAGGSGTYTWAPTTGLTPATGATVSAAPTATTTYVVTGNNGTCSGTASVTVTVVPNPAITVTPATTTYSCGSPAVALTAAGNSFTATAFSENFNSGTSSFTSTNNTTGGTTPAGTAFTVRANGYAPSGGSYPAITPGSNFIVSNSDTGGNGNSTFAFITSPVINASALTTLSLTYKTFYQYWDVNDTVQVQVSTNGTNWTTVQQYAQANVGTTTAFANQTVSLNSYAGNANLQIRFRWRAVWGYFWAIDDIAVTGNQTLPITWAPTTGLYTDAGATTAYTGGAAQTVYTKPATNTTYTATSTNGACSQTATAAVIVTGAAAITTQPAANTARCVGQSFTLSVVATNATTYQWNLGGSPITGATSSSYTVASATAANAGTYTVTVGSGAPCASVTSGNAVVVVNPLPTATISGTTTVCQGSAAPSITFTGAGGTTPYTFTYKINGGANQTVTTTSGNSVTVSQGTGTAGSFAYTLVSVQDGSSTACSQAQSGSATITVTPTPSATIAYGGSPYCANGGTANVTMSGTPGGTYASTTGLSINASTGAVNLAASTPGTYTVNYSVAAAGGCSSYSTTASVTITPVPSATIAYAGSPYCANGGTATVSMTGTSGGTYSSTTGLIINGTSGDINLAASTPGTYTVTYSVAASGGCAAYSTTTSVTVTPTPSATVSYAGTPYCNSVTSAMVTMTGTSGGTYSSTTGLTINSSTGEVNPSTSTVGTYTVTYSVAASGGCAAYSTTTSITINAQPAATISYAGTPYCANGGTANVTMTGSTGGTYSSATGLSINVSTGAVNLGASTPGTYTVTYAIPASGGCSAVNATASITITPTPAATISYAGTPYCNSVTSAMVAMTGTGGGSYSSTAGLTINASTGEVNPTTSTPGTYTVTYNVAAANGCAAYSTTTSITINVQPAATISYAGTPYCANGGTANVTMTGTTGGTYSSAAGLSINATTGAVTLATSTPGTYTVHYDIAASGGCAAVNATASITITPTPSATIAYVGTPYCANGGTATVNMTGTSGGAYSSTTGLTINSTTGDINLSASTPGTYTVTYSVAASGGCAAYSTTTSVTITPTPSATISYAGTPYCNSVTSVMVAMTGTSGGTYSSTTGLTINSTTGEVNPSTSTVGTYTVTYSVAASGGCAAYSTTTSITINAQPAATISYGGTPYCANGGTANVTMTGTTGGTYSSAAGLSINVSTGAVNLAASTPGTYTVTYAIPASGGCSAVNATASITITPTPSATIAYAGTPYCANGGTATVSMTGTSGGTYASTTGLSINATSGDINLSASTPGTYTVTYSVVASGGCAAYSTTTSVTITPTPSATISYAGTPYCNSVTSAMVSMTGTIGGTYSSTTGLSINSTTGEVNPSTSTVGTYTVTYSVAASGGCAAYSTTTSITINAQPAATISYAGTPYCANGGTANVIMSGTTGGTYTSAAGLSINASTGAVNLGTSTPGTYTVTYTVTASGGCSSASATATITITPTPSATIAYAGTPYCANGGTATVSMTGTSGGTYSSTTGLSINSTSGDINLGASTPGTYTVTYSVAASGGCAAYSTTTSVIITPTPSATISYVGTPYCNSVTSAMVTMTGTSGGTYISTTGLTINSTTGEVNPSTSTVGTYTVTYSVAASGGCAAYSTTTSITINAQPAATISYAGTPYCNSATSAMVSMTGTSGGTYSSTTGLTINSTTGEVNPSTSTVGTYTVIYSVAASGGCAAYSTTTSITINAQPAATISYGGTPYCANGGTANVTMTGTTGGTYSSTTGLSINASTGAVNLAASTPGTYTVHYDIAASGGCAAVNTTASITITPTPSATIVYAGSPYCANGGTATVSMTGTVGGSYSSTTGLSISASSGDINLGASTPGTYTVTYSVAASGGCAAYSTTTSVTITPTPSATISYAGTPYCNSVTSAMVAMTGTGGGTYSSTTGLTINSTTGEVNPSTSTVGTYTVTYSVAASGGCAAYSTTTSITINAQPSATISYAGTPYCANGGTATVSMTGTGGGTYSSTTGLSINSTSGDINLSASTPGAYTVTYSVAASGGCAAYSTTTSVTVTPTPAAMISYAGTPYCNSVTSAMVTMTGTSGGTYSSSTGLTINASTGEVNPSTSTPGTYTVTYNVAAANGCAAYSTSTSITINTQPAATITYGGTPYCANGGTANVTMTGTTGGTYSSAAGLSINASTGAVNLAASTPGTYTVTYNVAASGGCSSASATASITITPTPGATISYAGTPYCNGLGAAPVTMTGTAGGTYTSTTGLTINAATGEVNPSASTPGTYTVTYSVAASGGCAAYSTTTSVTITSQPAATIAYGGTPYCANGGTANVTMTGSTGGTYSSTTGLSINASTGAVNLAASTPGTYTVHYAIPASGGCSAVNATASITITPTPSATIAYAASPYCANGGTATVSMTGTTGGSYSSTTGLSINGTSGDINLAASTPGTYTVTYSVAANNGCAAYSTTTSVTITLTPSATIAYAASPYCANGGTAMVTMTGTGGGTYSSTTGLSISASNGNVNLSASTPGTYTVTYSVAASGGCAAYSTTASITITPAPGATISYAGTPYCSGLTSAPVTMTGTSGGTYSSTTGLSINASTGTVNPSVSTPGTYTVTYSIVAANGCAAYSTTTSITITTQPAATIAYGGTPYCSNGGTATVTMTGSTGGTYSSTSGLSINASTGAVNLSGSTPGTYTVTYAIPAGGGCGAVNATASITITPAPGATISYAGTPYCTTGGTAVVTQTGTTGGTYSANAGLSINSTNGNINLSASTPGTYTVTYTMPAASGCSGATATTSVTINPAVVITTQPMNQNVCAGSNVNLSVAASNASSYQWYHNGNPVSGATSATYTVMNAVPADGGSYYVQVNGTAPCGSLNSFTAIVNVDNPMVSLSPTTQNTTCGTAPVAITITTTDASNPVFTWNTIQDLYTDAAATMPYTGGPAMTVYALPSSDMEYSLTVTSNGCTGSATASLADIQVASSGNAIANTTGSTNADGYVQLGATEIHNNDCELLATVVPSGSNPISGPVNVTVSISSAFGDAGLTTQNEPYVGRVTMITPVQNASTSTGTITLYVTSTEMSGYNEILQYASNQAWTQAPTSAADPNIANIRVTKFPGTGGYQAGQGILITPTSVVFDNMLNAWAITFPTNGFSTFYVHTANATNTPLPVKLVKLAASNEGSRNKVEWESASEDELKTYIVERSADGNVFTAMDDVSAKGRAWGYIDYDNAPEVGYTYYRLKMVDYNGSYTISQTVKAYMQPTAGSIRVTAAPNPLRDVLNISVDGATTGDVVLTDVSGRTIATVKVEAGKASINTSAVAAGSYFLKYTNGSTTKTIKLTKD